MTRNRIAEGKGVCCEAESEGSHKQKSSPYAQKLNTRLHRLGYRSRNRAAQWSSGRRWSKFRGTLGKKTALPREASFEGGVSREHSTFLLNKTKEKEGLNLLLQESTV